MNWKEWIDVFVFDLDGTALGGYEPYERLPDPFAAFLDRLAAQGVAWCTNSTWHPLKQAEMIAGSAVRSRAAYLYGGTATKRGLPDGNASYRLDPDWDARSKAILARLDPLFPAWEHALRDAGCLETGRLETLSDDPLMRSFRVLPPRFEATWTLLERLRREAPGLYAFAGFSRETIYLQPVEMSKDVAVATLQRDLGVPADRILIAGDGANDLPMLRPDCARYVVCPANACAPVKEQVRRLKGVVGSLPCSDGVLEAAGMLLGA